MNRYYYPFERVAVVAMGCYMPDANNINMLWENILNKKVSIKEIPDNFFNKSVFYRSDIFGRPNKNDKTYTKVAAIPDDFDFMELSRKYKIPPAVSAYMDINQKSVIYCVDQVMGQLKSELPKEKTAVILCAGAPGTKFENLVRRTFFSNVKEHILNHPEVYGKLPQMDKVLKEVSDELLKDTQTVTEDTTTGYLQNITAGRIANIFDLWGPSYVLDGACASSLMTIAESVAGLLNHEYDAVITGGTEVTLTEVGLVAFSGINALSPDGSYPFDARANGFVMGLGGGIVVLKRLSDALRDGDHIHSIISGYCIGSDGKGKYIAAPSEEGQIRVITGACNMAGYSVDTIEMIEAHGTGTIVGDVVEVTSLKKAFERLGATKENYCGLGSIKSNIGHLRNAAGIAGFIKASLAVENKVLPATANIKQVNPKLQLEGSPFYILTENRQWTENPLHPRRANISSYGFGGADCHICIEEFRPEFLQKSYTFSNRKNESKFSQEKIREEAVFFSGESIDAVCSSIKEFIEKNENSSFEQAVYYNNLSVDNDKKWRVAICASAMDQLREKLNILEEYIREDKLNDSHLLGLKGIYVGNDPKIESSQIALMFPGQASQYPNMLKELYENYSAVKSFYHKADAIWKAKYNYSLMPLIFGEDEEQLKTELKNTKNTHPAMFVSNMAVYKLIEEAGIKADYMIGHSLGEITSLYAGEMVDLKSAINIIGERGFSFDRIDADNRGKMVSVRESAEKVEEIIKESGAKVSIANINSPEQTVVGGDSQQISVFVEYLKDKGLKYTELNVSHAFHTGIVAKAADEFEESIKDIKFSTPKCKVMACHMSDFYNNVSELEKMPEILKQQILSPVKFTHSVLKLYESGVRVFIEAGPSNVLTNLVKTILYDKDVKIVNIDSKNKSSAETFRQALAILFAHGVDVSYVPANSVLGLHKENVTNVIYQVESKPVDTSNKLTQNHEFAKNSCDLNREDSSFAHQKALTQDSKDSIVYSGVAIGLPGSFKKAFDDNNFGYIVEGRNMIEMLTDEEAQSIYDLNITRLVKTEKETIFKKIESINEVIHFAGKFGKMDMINDYLIDEKLLKQMTQTICAGVAAGYEALRDAGIPLVREYKKTASGAMLPGRLVLPKEMQDDTGIIYVNGLWPIETVISEVSKYTAAKFGSRTRVEILKFFESVISRVSDQDTKKLLADWFAMYYSRLSPNPGEADVYEFNHNFMTMLASQANNRLAQLIGATGPNMYLNTACASNASAITVAEDLIKAGHARRMIVIGADISSTKDLLPWFGAGFSSIGALTECDNLFEAAVPFDNRRSGMILGSGATGIVIERESDVLRRGMNGICRLLGTHTFNTAGHQSKIDTKKHSVELDRFIARMEKEYNFDRKDIASKLVYCSHETYSHKPGCSYMEKVSLESTFGEKYKEIKVINTKGMTGHIMGASIEEAVSAKVLQYQIIPPVVNFKEEDPELCGLNLSKGGEYEFEYVLRAVAAFGGQGNYHLMQRIAKGDERIIDERAYREWIERIASKDAELKYCGRILVAEEKGELFAPVEEGYAEAAPVAEATKIDTSRQINSSSGTDFGKISTMPATVVNQQQIIDEVLTIYANVTQYPKEMLDLSMELEADLGVDTVKQATIFSMIAEKFNLNHLEGQALSNLKTIGQMVDLVMQNTSVADSSVEVNEVKNSLGSEENDRNNMNLSNSDCEAEVLKLISEITLYPVELLERDMEMEADLGIDTVKQATIFSILGEKYGLNEEVAGNISQYRTIGDLIDLVKQNVKCDSKSLSDSEPVAKMPEKGDNENRLNVSRDVSVREQVMNIIAEITQYPVEMLQEDMEIEADLGVDTIKQATILSELSARFGVSEDVNFSPSQLKTIKSIIEAIESNTGGKIADNDNAKGIDAEKKQGTIEDETLKETGSNIERELSLQYPIIVEKNIDNKDFDLKDKKVLVIGNSPETVQGFAKHLKSISSEVKEFIFDEALDINGLENRAADIREAVKDIEVILDLGHLGEHIDFENLAKEKEDNLLYLNSLHRFVFYKELSKVIEKPSIRIMCVISSDGCLGYKQQDGFLENPFYGALCGFYKGLRKEFANSKVKILDIGKVKGSELTEEMISTVVEELEENFQDYEIGYDNGKRITLKLANVDRSELEFAANFDGNHFLITGGGNGITAEIIREVSKNIKAKFTIIGRTAIPSDIEELSKLDEAALEQKKLEIYDQLKKEGKKATPTEVQREFSKVTKAVSVHKLLKEIRESGSDAEYYSCDVSDYEKLKEVVDKAVSNFGPVNVIIHGAGVEKSRLIGQKTKEEFDEIFSVKAKGICNLYRLADKKDLKVLIGFSSISGRFGNEAQLDYCSANSFITGFISMVRSKHKGIRALSIAWSGWKDIGMAWRNEFVKENAEGMGLHLIEPERANAEFMHILNSNLNLNEVVVSKGLGTMVSAEKWHGIKNSVPMIDWISERDGKIDKVFKVFSVKADPIINHHRLGTTPIVPLVAYLEIGAEVHSLIFGKSEQYCFKDVMIYKPLKLFNEKAQELIMKIDEAPDKSINASLYNYFKPKIGDGRMMEIAELKISNKIGEYEYLKEITAVEIDGMKEMLLSESLERMRKIHNNAIQLGPLFMDDKSAQINKYKYNDYGVILTVALSEEQIRNKKYDLPNLLFNPAFADTLMQSCGVHASEGSDRIYLPSEIGEFGLVKVPKEPGLFKSYAKLVKSSDEEKVYNVILYNEKGEVCYYAKDVIVRRISQ
ncbi:SDR family NAD(P)-dependent oxidoreductase [Acetivibrio clariflavus]|uniref:SDR family NAD(P)-dependent oxidoreductase n=1 Tax=Acetivibrio clariflavus TaxID=288965 RepID=UPI0031F5A347